MTNSYKLAERINSDVNASVEYRTDLAQYGKPEHWCLPTAFGDCEDYALLKRKLLLEQGWPNDKLGLAVMLSACTTSNTLKPVLGGESYTPMGWVQYCNDNPGECKN